MQHYMPIICFYTAGRFHSISHQKEVLNGHITAISNSVQMPFFFLLVSCSKLFFFSFIWKTFFFHFIVASYKSVRSLKKSEFCLNLSWLAVSFFFFVHDYFFHFYFCNFSVFGNTLAIWILLVSSFTIWHLAIFLLLVFFLYKSLTQ